MNLLLNWLFAIIFITALQTSLSYFMTVYGIRPDFTLIFAIYAGTAAGRTAGMTVGFFVGLFADLLNMDIFGFNTFSLFLAGMGAGVMQKKVFKDSYLFPLLLSAGFGAAREILWSILVFLCGCRLTDFSAFASAAWGRVGYNVFLTLPLFFLFERLRRFTKR